MNSDVDGVKKALVERNIELGFGFLRELIEHPNLIEEIPSGTRLVLVPDDDPIVAEANLAGAMRQVREGKNVYIRHVATKGAAESSPSEADLAKINS